jgi:hypothetical protein
MLAPMLERMTDEEMAGFLIGLRAMHRIRTELADASAPSGETPAVADESPVPERDAR